MKQRCAWCTAWGHGSVCDRCTAEMLPVEQFGAARMLVEAGVDRMSLPERVRALSRNQFVALSSRFDTQWSIVQKRVDETRFLETFLLQRGFKEAVEDALIARIPISEDELKIFREAPRVDEVESIALHSPIPLNRTLAAIAQLRRRVLARDTFETVRYSVHSFEPLVAREAALALSLWFLRESRELPWLGRWDLENIAETARPLLADATLGPWAALAIRMGREDRSLDELLRAGLASADPELRFGCALVLRDEAELGRALDSGDALKAEVAQKTLGRFRSRLLFRRLAEDTDETKLEIIRSLSHPAEPALIEALLVGAERGSAEVRAAAMRYLYSGSLNETPAESRALIAEFLARADVPHEVVLKSLDWASEDVALFAAAVTSMLEGVSIEELGALLESNRWDLRRWFSNAAAAGDRETQLIDRWAKTPLAEPLLGLALDGEAVSRVIGVWDRWSGDRRELARVFAPAVEKHRSSAVRDALVPALWARFKSGSEQDRAAIMTVLAPFRYELKELRSLEPRGGPFGSRDLVRFYEIYAKADPNEAPSLLSEVLEQARQERGATKRDYPQLAGLVDVAFAHATELAASRPCTALRVAANLASYVVNTFREEPEHPALRDAVVRMRAHYGALMTAVDNAQPIDPSEARYSHVIEHLDTELKIARDVEERLEEAARYEAERRTRDEEQRRAREEAETRAAREEAERAARDAINISTSMIARPNIPPEGIDQEPLLPGQPLPTLHSYVAFMKALSSGTDVLALMAAHGINPQSWGSCVTAWTAVLQQRPNIAMRFAQLLQATWS